MDAGKRYRLGRLFGGDGRTLVLPVDHGLILGRVAGLENPVARLEELMALGPDGMLLSAGLLRHSVELFAHRGAPARIVTLDSFYRSRGEEDSAADLVTSVDDAARLGADAVKLLMAWNVTDRERQATATRISQVVSRAEALGLPVMVEPLMYEAPRNDDAVEAEGHAARIAMELGADIIKVAYPGPGLLAAWSAELRVPLVILGGPRSGEAEGVVDLAREAVGHGARGIVIGRNVWQREPDVTASLMRQLRAVVHPSAPA